MRANPEQSSQRNAARTPIIIVAVIAGWSAALAYVAVHAGSRAVEVTPAVAAEVRTDARQRPSGFADVVEKVKPAVFGIKVRIESDSALVPGSFDDESLPRMGANPKHVPRDGEGPRPRVETAQGVGFFISPDGYAVTSGHVMEHSRRAQITADDGATYTARLVGSDSVSDLAVIKVDGRADFPHLRFADRQPRIGDWVLAIGSPFGLGGTVSFWRAVAISARARTTTSCKSTRR